MSACSMNNEVTIELTANVAIKALKLKPEDILIVKYPGQLTFSVPDKVNTITCRDLIKELLESLEISNRTIYCPEPVDLHSCTLGELITLRDSINESIYDLEKRVDGQ